MRRLVQQPGSFANAFLSGACKFARVTVVPMVVLAIFSSRYAIRPLEPFFIFGGLFIAGVVLSGLCCTVPSLWQGIVHRWFSQR
jgi:hypothetical protein